jgi:hypothetical protein
MAVIASHVFNHVAATLDISQQLLFSFVARQLFVGICASYDHD